MKTKELRKLSDKELDAKVVELKEELVKLYAQVSTGTQLKSPGQIKQFRKTLARINTIKEEKS